MKIKASDYIAKLLVENGIKNVFSVVGGGAMHLNDSFGNYPGLRVIYNHHEQGSAMAAEGYARVNGVPAAVCVTTGPGGTNAITGVLCAWQDNIPMLVISGQVRYNITVESTGLPLRQNGEQEHYIIDTVKSITKYAVMIKDPNMIRYHIEKALYYATHGRKGPCWLDVPLNIQGATIETDSQVPFVPEPDEYNYSVKRVVDTLAAAKKPVLVVGSAVMSPEIHEKFLAFKEKLGIPVLSATSITAVMPYWEKGYYGTFGVFGGRTGNFIVQNADCLLVMGCRMTFKHIGFNYESFSPLSKKIVVDVDVNELKKNLLRIDVPVNADMSSFMDEISKQDINLSMDKEWIEYCDVLKERFPVYDDKYEKSEAVNPYYFAKVLRDALPEGAVRVLGNSCACVCVQQMGINKRGQQLFTNVNCGTMGYDLPAALGAAIAAGHEVYCITGDGSIQMNIQELQTVISNNIPVKIVIFNNNGYGAIVATQSNFFGRLSGCTKESGLVCPSFEGLAKAYGYPYFRCEKNVGVPDAVKKLIAFDGPCICELMIDGQGIEPKQKSKALPSGEFVTPPIYDLYPFLDDSVMKKYVDFETRAWRG